MIWGWTWRCLNLRQDDRVRLSLFASFLALLRTDVVPGLRVKTILLFLLATPVQFVFGMRFHVGARKAMRNRKPNMDVLVSLAATISYCYSVIVTALGVFVACSMSDEKDALAVQPPPHFFEAPTTVICVLLGGKWLEVRAKKSTLTVLQSLLSSRESQAGGEVELKTTTEEDKGTKIPHSFRMGPHRGRNLRARRRHDPGGWGCGSECEWSICSRGGGTSPRGRVS